MNAQRIVVMTTNTTPYTCLFAYGFPPMGVGKVPAIIKQISIHHIENTTGLKVINNQIDFIRGNVWDRTRNDNVQDDEGKIYKNMIYIHGETLVKSLVNMFGNIFKSHNKKRKFPKSFDKTKNKNQPKNKRRKLDMIKSANTNSNQEINDEKDIESIALSDNNSEKRFSQNKNVMYHQSDLDLPNIGTTGYIFFAPHVFYENGDSFYSQHLCVNDTAFDNKSIEELRYEDYTKSSSSINNINKLNINNNIILNELSPSNNDSIDQPILINNSTNQLSTLNNNAFTKLNNFIFDQIPQMQNNINQLVSSNKTMQNNTV